MLVPGLTDAPHNIAGLADFVATLTNVERVEVLPFHQMGEYKWDQLGYDYKALLALKTRNAIIFSPHPRAKRATAEAARIVLKAAIAAGAPEQLIGWIDEPTVALS